MRVTACVPCYPPSSRVGAWLTTHELLAHLAAAGHDVEVVTYLVRGDTYTLDGVTVHGWRSPTLRDLVRRSDVVVSHLGDQGHGALQASRADRPLIRLAHSEPHPALSPSPFTHCGPTAFAVYNSQATRDAWGWDGPGEVIAPIVRPDLYRTTPGNRVTLCNLSPEKGGRVFWHLADTMPGTEFLGVLGGYGRQMLPGFASAVPVVGALDGDNVRVTPPAVDVRDVFRQTRVLLMPSERESYGRVAIEAACSGIPTIAHPLPGLLEALGDAGTWRHRDDLTGWRDAVETLTTDPDAWAEAAAAAVDRAAQLDPDTDLDRFADVAATVAGVGVAA